MNDSLIQLNSTIKAEADKIFFAHGLLDILNSFGTAYITGSYALGLMTWRDLDIYLQVDNFSRQTFLSSGVKYPPLLTR